MKASSSPPVRNYKLLHQHLSLTDINFSTKVILGIVELTIQPLKDNLKHIRLNAKQVRVYRVSLNNKVEAPFQYCDPMLEIVESGNTIRDLESFGEAHLAGCNLVDSDINGGELNIRIPSEAYSCGLISTEKQLVVFIEFSLENPLGGLIFSIPEPWEPGQSLSQRSAHMFSSSYENSNRLWFPCIDTLSELCTWKCEFTVDESMMAICSGELTDTFFSGDCKRKTYVYSLETPTAAPNIGLAVGPFEIYVDPNMHEVTHFCLPHLLPLLKASVKSLHETFIYYESILQSSFPYSSYKQVFVDESYSDYAAYSSLSILSTNLLHSSSIIDQTYESRKIASESLASQFFGCFITTERWSDIWLNKGIAKYLSGLYVKKTFGNNEYRDMIHEQMSRVVEYEEKYGGILLDSSRAPPSSSTIRGEQGSRESSREDPTFFSHFPTSNINTISPEYMDVLGLKAHLAVRMLAHRIGELQLIQVLNKQLCLATSAASQVKNSVPHPWNNMTINTLSFTHSIFLVTGKDMSVFMDQWIRTRGHARFHMEFVFNRKRNTIEMTISQEAAHQGQRGIRRYVGPVTVAVQELDGWFSYTLAVENITSKHDITCHSKSRRNKKKKIPLCNNEEVDMDLSAMDDSPILWIRLDPDMVLIRSLDIAQPDFQWQYQLRHERDVTAQSEAVVALARYPTPNTRKALTDIIENEQCFYKVRCRSTHCLASVANSMASNWEGPPAMLVIFKKMFGSFAASHIVKQNDFSILQSYFLQKEIPKAMAKLRNTHGICPPEVLKFLLDLFKYNDNSKNTFSDNYYRAALIDALGHTVTPVVSVIACENDISAESLSPDTKLVLEEISRYLNLEKLLPCYKYTVSISCLRVIRKLQKTGHLPSNSLIFKDYAVVGQFVNIRVCALECLVDFVRLEGKSGDIDHLLTIIEKDPNLYVRHKLCRFIVDNPFFDKGRHHKNDTPGLVNRLWSLMNSSFWYDSRLRCDIVDIYFKLYGRKKPVMIPLPSERLSFTRENQIGDKKNNFTIPRNQKRKIGESDILENSISPLPDQGRPVLESGEIPDYFNVEESNESETEKKIQKKKKKEKKKHKHHHHHHKHHHHKKTRCKSPSPSSVSANASLSKPHKNKEENDEERLSLFFEETSGSGLHGGLSSGSSSPSLNDDSPSIHP